MVYPTRTAVIDPDTPEINLVLRKVTLGEGPIPVNTITDGCYYSGHPTNGGFRGGMGQQAFGFGMAPPPNGLSIIGFSKFGWGRLNYQPGNLVGNDAFQLQQGWVGRSGVGQALFAWGGPFQNAADTAPLGVWAYKATKTSAMISFDGGEYTFVPAWEDIDVDWGFTRAQLSSVTIYRTAESPLSEIGRFGVMSIYGITLNSDPLGINGNIFGLETTDDAGVLKLNQYIMYPTPIVAGYGQYLFEGIVYEPGVFSNTWAMSSLQDGGGNFQHVLTNYNSNVPMYASLGVIGTPIYTHYLPDILVDTDHKSIGGTALRDGWLSSYVDAQGNNQYIIVNREWVTYQKINLIGGEEDWCLDYTPGNSVTILQDTDGTFLVLIMNGGVATLWTAGAPAPGFDGCPFDPPFPPWPAPDPPVGNPLIRSWGFSQDGHDFYVLRLGEEGTLIYDATTGQWSEWDGASVNYWRATLGMNWIGIGRDNLNAGAASNVIAGDIERGILWSLDPALGYDESVAEDATTGDYFVRAVRGGVPFRGRHRSRTNGIWLTISNGQPTVPFAAVTLRTSDDQGKTWQDRGTITVEPANYNQDLYWRSLGVMRAPGRLFEFEDNGAMIRIDGATIDMSKDDQGGDS